MRRGQLPPGWASPPTTDHLNRPCPRPRPHQLCSVIESPHSARQTRAHYLIGNGEMWATTGGATDVEVVRLGSQALWSHSGATASVMRTGLSERMAAQSLQQGIRAFRDRDRWAALNGVRQLDGPDPLTRCSLLDIHLVSAPVGAVRDYSRQLDLSCGLASHQWHDDRGCHTQEGWVSHPDQVGVITRTVPPDPQSAMALFLTDPQLRETTVISPAQVETNPHGPVCVLEAKLTLPLDERTKVTTYVLARVVTDGQVRAERSVLHIDGARQVTVIWSARSRTELATRHGLSGQLQEEVVSQVASACRRLDVIRQRHIADVQQAMKVTAVSITPGSASDEHSAGASDTSAGPTAIQGSSRRAPRHPRTEHPGTGANRPQIEYDYGRYVLMSIGRGSAIPPPTPISGPLPTKHPLTSGEDLLPRGYEINELWAAQQLVALETGAITSATGFLDLLRRIANAGSHYAETVYNAPGWVVHRSTDIRAFVSPTRFDDDLPSRTLWPLGGAWLGVMALDLCDFTADVSGLQRSWPLLRGGLAFLNHWYQGRTRGSAPGADPELAELTRVTASDHAAVRHFAHSFIDLGGKYGLIDAYDRHIVTQLQANLPGAPGSGAPADRQGLGQWQQVLAEKPGTPDDFIELDFRRAYGRTASVIERIVRADSFTPEGLRIVELLPDLPATWNGGEISNVRLRGGLAFSLRWADGEPRDIQLHSLQPAAVRIQWGGLQQSALLRPGTPCTSLDWVRLRETSQRVQESSTESSP